MTAPDPRSRPSKGHETPIDGTATTRTDAPVRPHDADAPDALDAWLESVTANGAPSIGHGNGRSPHHSKANGSRPGTGDTPLVATARHFHARIGDAEASHATDISETTIWERIMSSQLTSNQPTIVQQSPRVSIQARPPAQSKEDGEGRPFPIIDRFAGGHPAFSAILAAAVILAIVAIFRVIGAPPSGPTDHSSSTTGPASNPALAAGSPLASPSAFDCAGPVSASKGSTTRTSDYVPLNPVTDPALIDEANATLTIALECFDPDIPNQPNAIPSLAMTDATRDRIEAVRSMWPVDPWGYGASFDPENTALIDIDHRVKSTKIEPSELFEMPNGRLGAIAYQVSELPEFQPNGEPFLGFIAFFLSFRPGEGPSETPLVLTEYFPLCADEADGTTFCDSVTIPSPGHVNGSTLAATPLASPTASPVASPAVQTATPAAAEDGTLLIDNGSGIISRPLDGSPETTLTTYDQSEPPIYRRTTVPDIVMGSDAKTAHNVRTGQVLGTNPYESAIVIGPFWVQYTSQNPAVPVDARIVDLRTMESVGFFDLAGVDPAGLGLQWLIEGTESGTLSVGFIDRAEATGPTLTPTALLIDGTLQRTRVVPLWSPPGPNNDVLAFSPDGSLVAYLTGTAGNVAIRVETIAGEPIGNIPWPDDTPVAHLVLPNAQTLLVMSEGQVMRADLAAGTEPAPIAGYADEIWNTALSPDGSHLLFATFDPVTGSNGQDNMAWHWLDIGTGEVQPIPQATGGHPFWPGSSYTADTVMLWVPVGPLGNATYRVLFVDMTTAAVTVAQPTGVTSGLAPGETISDDGAVFAAYGIGSPDAPRFRILEGWGSIPLSGQLLVFDRANRSVVQIPFPDSGLPQEIIEPALTVSPDGRHVVLSVRWTDANGEHAQSWITTTDGQGAWTPVEGGLVVGWVGE